jgi:hypothetical protein
LLLIFACVLSSRRLNRYAVLVGAVGVLLIFSKNPAPFACLAMLGIALPLQFKSISGKHIAVYLSLGLLSIISIVVTAKYDTSVHVNTVNNIFVRVLPDDDKVSLFHERYGMPVSEDLRSCSGKNVLACFGDSPLVTVGPSRNYDIRNDTEFSKWVHNQGRRAYVSYLLSSPFATIGQMNSAFGASFTNQTLRILSRALLMLNRYPGSVSNYDKLESYPCYRNGAPFGVDSLVILGRMLAGIGIANMVGVIICFLAAFIIAFFVPSTGFMFASITLGTSIPLFFLCFYGDGMEIERHTLPATIFAVMGLAVFVVSVAVCLLKLIYRRFPQTRNVLSFLENADGSQPDFRTEQ